MRSTDRSAGPLRWLKAALTGLLPTPPTPVQISKGLSLWLDEKRGSRQGADYRDIRSVFREARLLDDPPSGADISWWDLVQGRVRLNFDQERLARARHAESLSMDFEKAELTKLGIETDPVWMAIDDNTAGYDVLSYRPTLVGESNLLIEVKSTIASPLRFYVSRNEWENADQIGEAYLFHIWDMDKSPPILHIRTVEEIRPHIPSDNEKGKWSNALIPIG